MGVRVFSVMLSLLALLSLKCPAVLRLTGNPSGALPPVSAPLVLGVIGHSTLIISAPSAPNHLLHPGPALTQVKSRTLIPSSGLVHCVAFFWVLTMMILLIVT